MDPQRLSRHVLQPDVVRGLLQGYQGPYSIGIGRDPRGGQGPAVIVEVIDPAALQAPPVVEFDGQAVPVVVRGGYQRPRVLAH